MRTERVGGLDVLVVDGEGAPVGTAYVAELVATAFEAGAQTIAVAAERLDPAFFELRTGVAGEMVQTLVNYRLRLAVVGRLPDAAHASRSFGGFVLEGNRGDGPWFVATLGELAERLAAAR